MKWCSTDARIISAFPRDTWLRDQQHSTSTGLIRCSPPNHVDDRGGDDDGGGVSPLRVQIVSAIADGKAEPDFDAEIEPRARRRR
jgi:hypothetical protein